jgi:hypothetical protein
MLALALRKPKNKSTKVAKSAKRLLEGLESRLLMSVSVVEYAPTGAGFLTNSHIAEDSAGFLYTAASGGGLIKLDPISGTTTFIDIPHQTAHPGGLILNSADLTIDSAGNFWMTESFFDPNAVNPEDFFTGEVLKVSPSGTLLATFNLGASHAFSFSPTFGADGKLYFASFGIGAPTVDGDSTFTNAIIELNTGGGFTVHPITRTDANVTDLKIASNGDVIVTLTGHSFEPPVGDPYQTDSSLAVLRSGTVTNVALDGAANPKNILGSLSIADDGSIWLPLAYSGNAFSGGGNQIVQATLSPALVPTYTSYSIPGVAADDPIFAVGVLAASDGNVYVTESNGTHIDIVEGGVVSRVEIASGNTAWTVPQQFGDSIYFASLSGNNFARIDLPPDVGFSAAGVPVPDHVENSSFSALVATFVGPVDTYTATIDWGNGVITNGTVALVSGVYTVIGSINYATQGTKNISVHIVGGSNDVTVNTSVAITDIPLVVTAQAPILLGRIAIGTTAFFTDDPDSTASRFNATINWGDGSTSAGVIVPLGGGQYTVLSLHVYRRSGNYTLKTTITTISGEDAGATASASVVIHV